MISTKTALKAAKSALDAHKYEEAADEARSILAVDPQNYHANVFLGLALDKQEKNDESEEAYGNASKLKNDDPLVWQGLITLYEKQASKKIDEYGIAALRLAELYEKADDKHRCQSVVDKYVGFAKRHGTRTQYKHALEIMLPTSTVYNYLEGRVPHPSFTFTRIVEISESEEKERINKLIGERRTRLGAKIGQVTTEVRREVFVGSNLEYLYQCIIDWTNDDDIRRQYEERLLQRAYDTLTVLPAQDKVAKQREVQKLAEGFVVLRHPFVLAWGLILEWKDVESIGQIDGGIFRDYVRLFPQEGLSKVIRGFLESEISPFSKEPFTIEGEEGEEELLPLSVEERLFSMTEGFEESSRSILSQRLMGEYYLHLEEYASAADCARKAQSLLLLELQTSGVELHNNYDAVHIILGTALVHYQSPRHHIEAKNLFEAILQRKPLNTAALIGVGLVLEEEEDYDGAIEFFSRALERGSNLKIKAELAWCKTMKGETQIGLEELEQCLSELETPENSELRDLKAEVFYRIGICLWRLSTSRAERKDRNGAYARFLRCLQLNMNYASAYTSLGIYYTDYAKDRKRARKCFQKAFELSPSEVVAAERLAQSFADKKEWDLVEAVSQRVVDSGKVRPPPGSKKKGISWPFAALGVCHLNNQDYMKAIVAFQSALRISPQDYHCWVGLGESYHTAGRYIAATKALEHAQTLESTAGHDVTAYAWFSRYMLANVKRELGEFDNAIGVYEQVLTLIPDEFGVIIALMQAHIESGWHSIELGLFGRAADSAAKAIGVAEKIVQHRPDAFNVWKSVGDACSIFSQVPVHLRQLPQRELANILQNGQAVEAYELLADIDTVGEQNIKELEDDSQPASISACLDAAILAQKRAIHVCATNIHAQAVAWYNLGWTEYRASVSLTDETTKKASKKASPYLRASVRCFKRAIELEAGNSEFWNALGIVTTQLNAKVAQHAFVRSLYLNDRSAAVWTNLGTLYLLQNDYQLSSDAFTRGQSADPDYAHAWLGQGILSLLAGNKQEAQAMFTHAFEIANSASLITKRLYSSSTFDSLLSQESFREISALLQPLFSLHQLAAQAPSEVAFYHLSALFAERVGDHDEAITTLTDVCTKVEAEYEVSESATALAQFAQAKADLARAHLAAEDFEQAAENAETALDLSSDEDSTGPDATKRHKLRLSAHLTAGLAYHNLGKTENAISMFRATLDESQGNPDAVCLLAQVLWAKGGSAERDVAREQLFDSVEKHPDHADSIILLSIIALIDDDQDTIDAVSADLQSLRTRADLDARQMQRINSLLTALSKLTSGGKDDADLAEAASAIMLNPAQPYGWLQMGELSDELYPAEMALLTALRAAAKGSLHAEDLARAYAGTSRIADAQRAVMVSPWITAGWDGIT